MFSLLLRSGPAEDQDGARKVFDLYRENPSAAGRKKLETRSRARPTAGLSSGEGPVSTPGARVTTGEILRSGQFRARKHAMTSALKSRLRKVRPWLGNLRRWPRHTRYCPLCRGYLAGFESFGAIPRPEARCPRCGSLERHRLVWLFMGARTNLFDGTRKRMLHVAPEPAVDAALAHVRGVDRITAELLNESAMVRMDLTDIQLAAEHFDVIYCPPSLNTFRTTGRPCGSFTGCSERGDGPFSRFPCFGRPHSRTPPRLRPQSDSAYSVRRTTYESTERTTGPGW